ncbi:MAG TPA: hypothetical protein VJB57_00595 [Dehalococcoidia bacterium]|nr:hypothetical protein [Dehalococcoidia bacterium]
MTRRDGDVFRALQVLNHLPGVESLVFAHYRDQVSAGRGKALVD